MLTKEKQLALLKKHFGFDSFRPNQEAIINDVLSGNDLLAIMPTGGGKSLCFQLPALCLSGTAIVISPLIALMKDQVDALRANGIAAAYYNSSQETTLQQEVLQRLQKNTIKLLYVAPESLSLLLPHLNKENVSLFAIDEAHCISAWGHDFRPAYTRLGTLRQEFPKTPVLAFTATADSATQDDIIHQLQLQNPKKHVASFDRKNLFLEVRPGTNRLQQIVSFLKTRKQESGIIYCLSRKSTETIAQKLTQNGLQAQAYHAGLEAETRGRIQEDFINDRTGIIVATIAFGMGIDKSNVRWVIHYNMPKNIEGYYQEIGRSGRDGLPADTLLFYSYSDVIRLRQFIEDSNTKEVQLAKLERMQQFSEALSCRRIALLNYFGEHTAENCGNCDNCKAPPKFFDGTTLAQKVCSAVYRLKEQEALGMVVDVLRGAQNANVHAKGYHTLKTYGVAKDVSWLDLQQYGIQMINQGVLEVRFHEKGRLLLTPLAKKVLFQGHTIKLAALQPKATVKTAPTNVVGNHPELYEKLRALRSKIAKEEGVPAYIIFSDAALKSMEALLPNNEAAFLQVNGVGEVKKEKYGARFLSVIADYIAENELPETPLPRKKTKTRTQDKTFTLFQEGKTVAEIAKVRGFTESTIFSHLIQLHQEGKPIDLSSFISPQEINQILKARDTQPKDSYSLKPIFEDLEGNLPYWKIRLGLYLEEA